MHLQFECHSQSVVGRIVWRIFDETLPPVPPKIDAPLKATKETCKMMQHIERLQHCFILVKELDLLDLVKP